MKTRSVITVHHSERLRSGLKMKQNPALCWFTEDIPEAVG